jgi:hypothetical protein
MAIEVLAFPMVCGALLGWCLSWTFPVAGAPGFIAYASHVPAATAFWCWMVGSLFMQVNCLSSPLMLLSPLQPSACTRLDRQSRSSAARRILVHPGPARARHPPRPGHPRPLVLGTHDEDHREREDVLHCRLDSGRGNEHHLPRDPVSAALPLDAHVRELCS